MIEEVNIEALDAIVGRIFAFNQRNLGNEKQRFVLQYYGQLLDPDSARAYDQLSSEVSSFNLIPRFFEEGGKQVINLERPLPISKPFNPRINLIFFILTLISVLIAGGLFSFEGNLPSDLLQAISVLMMNGWPFALSLLAILAAHEFGHYFAGKRNNVQVTLPYFIPMPFSAFGTLGAFINMRSYPKNKKALFDLSITGPLCGFAVSVIVLVIGLKLSTLNALPSAPAANASIQMEGNSLIYLLLKYLVFGKLLPSPHQLSGIPLFIYWGQYFFTGQPFPWGSLDVMLHPVAWAGWAGLFITGINLLPAGQLDGGHIFASAFGVQNARRLFPYILVAMVLMGFFWETWWIWAVLIFLMGRFYAEPLDQITPLDKKRKWLGWLAIVLFVITFIPVPLMII